MAIFIFQPVQTVEQVIGAAGQNGLNLFEQIIFLFIAIVLTQFVNNWMSKKKIAKSKEEIVSTFADDQAKFRKEVLSLYDKEREKNQKLIDELESYKSEYGDLTEQYQQLSDKYTQLHKELLNIKEELLETKKERDKLQGRVKLLEDEKGQLEGEVKKLQSIINNMRKNKK